MPLREDIRTERTTMVITANSHWHVRCSWRLEDGRVESHRLEVMGDPDRFFDNHCHNGHEHGEEILCELLGRPTEGPWVLTRTWFSPD